MSGKATQLNCSYIILDIAITALAYFSYYSYKKKWILVSNDQFTFSTNIYCNSCCAFLCLKLPLLYLATLKPGFS
jgi:hypothetical protein